MSAEQGDVAAIREALYQLPHGRRNHELLASALAALDRLAAANAENANLNSENRDLLEKWSERGAALERAERERDELDGRLSNAISALSDADGDRGRFIARVEKAERALAEIDAWAGRMPDAGFTDADPRWNWWMERPRL